MKAPVTLRLQLLLSLFLVWAIQVSAQNPVSCSFTVSEIVCIEQAVAITYTGNAPASAIYTWNFDGATIVSGSGQGPYSVKWLQAGEKHITLTVASGNDGCTLTRLVHVKALPEIFHMTGGGIYPQGSTGVHVGLSGSQSGIIYTLFRNQVATSVTRVGTGNPIDFGLITEPGIYTCRARWDELECARYMEGSVAVDYTNTHTCTFTVPENVCIEQSATITFTGNFPATAQYTWYFGGATVISGSGQGPYSVKWTTAGEKHVYVTVRSGNDSCSSTRMVQVKALPTIFNITGGGTYPQGGIGVHIGLSGSQTGVIYTLLLNQVITTITRTGTGGALDFGLITQPGVYTCKARIDGLECGRMMNGSVTVAIGNTSGCSFTVSENVCIEQPVIITYTGNYPATAQYTWYFGGATVLSGSGQGPYTVKWLTAGEKHLYLTVRYGNDSCSNTRVVQVRALPEIFHMTGGGIYPQGGIGIHVGLSGSQTGIIYTLLRNNVATTITRAGTGSPIDFGLITEPGIYTCKARWDGLECSRMMEGSVAVDFSNSPLCTFTVPENVCIEQAVTITFTGNFPATAQYTWYFGGATVISGTGQGPYSVKWLTSGEKHVYVTVKSGNDSCSSTRLVQVKVLPNVYHMTGGGTVPPNGPGVSVGLSGSQTGVIYTLLLNQVPTQITRAGTGNALDFGLITQPGVYSCKARWDGLECSRMMEGTVTVVIGNPIYELRICIVTFDRVSGRNLIVWNKPATNTIHHFNIYRETAVNNQFQKIGEVPYASFSSWADPTSEPLVRSYKYKISASDYNQAESPLSPYHKTIHLNVMPGYNCNNLIWNPYEGFDFFTYRIYRKLNSSNNYLLIDSVASNITSYTDFNAGPGAASYFIEVIRPTPCSPSKSGEIMSAMSNTFTLLPEGDKSIPDLTYSPNPVLDILSVRFQAAQADQCTFIVTNAEGRVMQHGEFNGGEVVLNFSSYRKGLYIVKIMNGESLSVFKVMKL